MAKLRCVIERITFQSPETGYSVLKAKVKDHKDLVTIVGNMLDVNIGSVLLIEGEWKVDSRYGQQFAAQTWEETMPATVYGIEKYLGSGLIKGIGPKFANLIVRQFGTDTIQIIEDESDRLFEVPGIGEKRVERIRESWERQKDIKNVMIFLQDHGVSTAFAAKIFKTYGKESIDKVKENPYRLADDIWGIGFKTADSIAKKMDYADDDPRRLRSGLIYTLNQLADAGNVYAERKQLTETACQLLDAKEEPITEVLADMIIKQDVIVEEDAVYLPAFYHSEVNVARKIKLLNQNETLFSVSVKVDLDKIAREAGVQYEDVQRLAIEQAVQSKVMVLTGGPGTGKTTTTQGIIAALKSLGLKVLLAAPTGRAAKRMSEATGMEAKTIHRLLEFSPADGYKHNQDNPLKGDALIVDEASMIDLILMNSLLKAMPLEMRLILVGDIDQLPSVGAGNVLADIINSDVVPVVRLTTIFRQAQASRIIMSAHAVNHGLMPNLTNGQNSDFFFIRNEDPQSVSAAIVDLVRNRLPKAYHVSPDSIQILTPMQRGIVGASNLNIAVQDVVNPSTQMLRRSGYTYRQGDRVMQIRNNYDKDVYNGDIGKISEVDMEDRMLTVNFDGRNVVYDLTELDELTLAYATTIHKSQGSEYPIVVMPILMTHYVMLQRNLIYTGITRAKKVCIMIGSQRALSYAIYNQTVTKRNTRLRERLNDSLEANNTMMMAAEERSEYKKTEQTN